MVSVIKCIVGPRLYKINQQFSSTEASNGKIYQPNIVEKCGDQIIRTMSWAWALGVYASPFIAIVLYRRGYFVYEGVNSMFKIVTVVGVLFLASACLRGIGRWANPEYLTFLATLNDFRKNMNTDNKRALLRYDFEFHAWPAEFRASEVDEDKDHSRITTRSSYAQISLIDKIKQFPLFIVGYIFAHTVGCKMVYPGSVGILQSAMSTMLLQGRTQLLNQGGERTKLIARDGNEIDTMFVDQENNKTSPNGNKLVICSEGNAGYYEVGIMSTAIEAGYSVLGWNHPGFGGSTGTPYPEQEQNGIDVVIQYAIHKLGFQPCDVILYAWSIGGYTATWGAMNYPEIHAVVLDATFDDLEPLAISKMPTSWKHLVSRTIKDHMNLNNSEQLSRYPGRVLFIRRTDDEMITTENPPTLRSNRANNLVLKFLQYRYPKIVEGSTEDVLKSWLIVDRTYQNSLWNKYSVNEEMCKSILKEHFAGNPRTFPTNLGKDLADDVKAQIILFLARTHMVDYNSTHCTELPKQLFHVPWDPTD